MICGHTGQVKKSKQEKKSEREPEQEQEELQQQEGEGEEEEEEQQQQQQIKHLLETMQTSFYLMYPGHFTSLKISPNPSRSTFNM